MQTLLLQPADKVLFVKQLNDYASRAVKSRIRSTWAAKTGKSERTFQDKMITHRPFKGEELDIVFKLFCQELGQDVFYKQFVQFIDKMSNGDGRTIDKAQSDEIQKLIEQNDEMITSKILNL